MHWSFEKASALVWLEGMLEGLEQPEATMEGVAGKVLKQECI